METAHGSAAEFLEADIDFHLAIGQAAHNSILLNALHLIRNLLQKWIGATLKLDGVEAKALDHHRAIFLAIAKKNVPAARAAMQVHLEEMARHYVKARTSGSAETQDSNAQLT